MVVHRGFYAFPAKSGKQFATRGWQVSDINERMHICLLSSYLRRTRLDFNPRPSAPFFFRFLERFTTTLRDGRTRFFFFFNPSMNESEYRSANKNRKHLLVKFVELLECNVLWKRVEIGHGDRLLESWRDFVPFLLLKLTICSQSCSYESLVFFFFLISMVKIYRSKWNPYKLTNEWRHVVFIHGFSESFTSGWMEIHYYLN